MASRVVLAIFLFCAQLCLTKRKTTTNYFQDGSFPMCNYPARSTPFAPLLELDLRRIQNLEQLFILTRHGTRAGRLLPSHIFPNIDTSNANTQWHCNFSTVTTSMYNDSRQWISTAKSFINRGEFIGGNCNSEQALYQSIAQLTTNAKLIKKFYIGDQSHHIMTRHALKAIASSIKSGVSNDPNLKVMAANLQRCMAAAQVFLSELLHIHNSSVKLHTYTHDTLSDPLIPMTDAQCPKLNQFISQTGQQSSAFKAFAKSALYNKVTKEWKEVVGQQISYIHAFETIEMYCAGLHVPISPQLMTDVYNWTMQYEKALMSNGGISEETMTLAAMPFGYILYSLISDKVLHKTNGYMNASEAKLVLFSARGQLQQYVGGALGVPGMGSEPRYANMLMFEIYARNQSFHLSSDSDDSDDDDSNASSDESSDRSDSDSDSDEDSDEATKSSSDSNGISDGLVLTPPGPPSGRRLLSFSNLFHKIFAGNSHHHKDHTEKQEQSNDDNDDNDDGSSELTELHESKNEDNDQSADSNDSSDSSDSSDSNEITGNIFDDYLFRISDMGAFLPFPGCEEEYGIGSQLCTLTKLMAKLDEFALPLLEWQPFCAQMTDAPAIDALSNGIAAQARAIIGPISASNVITEGEGGDAGADSPDGDGDSDSDDTHSKSSGVSVNAGIKPAATVAANLNTSDYFSNTMTKFAADLWLLMVGFLLGALVVFIFDRIKCIKEYMSRNNDNKSFTVTTNYRQIPDISEFDFDD